MCWLYKKKRSYKRPSYTIYYFIGPGEATSRLAPGDHTGTSYAFDIYDFANGTYHYEI